MVVDAANPAVEVGGEVQADTVRMDAHTVVRLRGPLSLSTAPRVGNLLVKLLAEGRPVLADLTRLRSGWAPAVEIFPMALRAGGGWPIARLVLFGADPELTRNMMAVRVPERVPLVADEVAALARMHDRPEVVHRHLSLPNSPTSGRAARHAADVACQDWRVPHVAADLVLITEELVANAVEHTGGAPRLTITLGPREVTVSVRDDLPGASPRPQLSCIGRPCGRGLQVVTALATHWGVTQHDDGKTVWATVTTAEPCGQPVETGSRK
jgi:hypothetical protein